MSDDTQCQNTDREIWREREDDYYADSIHVTASGSIGINCGGYVKVRPVRDWHSMDARIASLQSAITKITEATQAYLPSDGISAKDCLSQILEVLDRLKAESATGASQTGGSS